MRAIPVIFLCAAALAACDSGDSNSSGGDKDGATQEDASAAEKDATVVVDEDAAVAVEQDAAAGELDAGELDAGELDAAVSEDAEADASVEDTSVPDTSVPDTSVPLTADQMLEAQVTAKMRECAVIAATGDYKANKVVDTFDRCISNCYLAATCPVLLGVFCEQADVPAGLGACLKACADAPKSDGFACTSGNQKIPHLWVCDGVAVACDAEGCTPGCDDKSDEVGCTDTIQCTAEGKPKNLLQYFVCDGYQDCDDGKDEVGCAAACPG